jgi:hypothetical protein
MEMSSCSSNSWLVWASQLSVLTKLTPKLVCMSSHQARKLLLIPYPLLSVHVYGIICCFIGHFPWSSHELISPKQASQPRREIFNSEAQLLRKKQLPYFFIPSWKQLYTKISIMSLLCQDIGVFAFQLNVPLLRRCWIISCQCDSFLHEGTPACAHSCDLTYAVIL